MRFRNAPLRPAGERHFQGLPRPWLLLLVLAVAALAGRSLPSPYSRVSPGGVYELGSRVRVPPELRREIGWLAFTAVRVRQASYADWLLGSLDSTGRLVLTSELRPADVSTRDYVAVRRKFMEQSKTVATIVALRRAGFAVSYAEGALVEQVSAGSPASGQVRVGDVVRAADGQPVRTAAELGEQIRQRRVGQEIVLELVRDGRRIHLSVPTADASHEPGRPTLGLRLSTFVFEPRPPFAVRLVSDNVVGPSTGFMFCLGLLDVLTGGDLAGGRRVAGTGTLSLDGRVGPVGGVAEKVVAAEREGAELFLVPRENQEQAARAAQTSQVIPVGTLDEALEALGELGGSLAP